MKTFIHHPLHKHGLILREMSDKCSERCFICKADFMCEDKHVRGRPTYCCENCRFFIHSSCADLPLEIHHPSHPNHLLVLSKVPTESSDCYGCKTKNYRYNFSPRYSCDDCVFRLCVRCAIATLPPPPAPPHPKSTIEEEEAAFDLLEHFISHEHPLTSLDVKMLTDINCEVCYRKVVGPVYGCPVCFFLIHRSCAQLPREIMQHPLHPQHPLTLHMQNEVKCRACGYRGTDYKYCCDSNKNECGFALHARCAASTLPPPYWKRDISLAIHHFSHQHPLVPFPIKSECYIYCYICSNEFTTSGEVVYGCLDCILFIHKQCTELPQQQVHSVHPQHPLTLINNSSTCRLCISYKTFVFHCESCDFCVCIECAAAGDGASSEIQHFGHGHPLTLRSNMESGSYCAAGCINKFDTSQSYTCKTCSTFQIHKSCAELLQSVLGQKKLEKLPLVLEDHPFHPSHSLTGVVVNSEPKIVRCSACLHQIERFMFQCAECDFNLDIHCASMTKPTICHQPHKHKLTYFPQIGYEPTLLCNYCGITCNTDLYRCVECNFNIHHDCSSLPLIVKDEHHYYPLSLCDKALGDQADRNVFYCDRCELNRDPDLGVYTYEESGYIAHIYCIVPKEEPKRLKVAEMVQLKWDTQISKQEAKLEEAQRKLNKIKEELESLKARKEQDLLKKAIKEELR